MLRKRKLITEPRGNVIERSLARLPLLQKLLPGAPKSLEHVEHLVDVFASFALLDGKVDRSEANVALDLLRHAYPEADHGWLARRLQRSFKSTPEIAVLAARVKQSLSQTQVVSLGLQLFLLVESSKQRSKGRQAFLEFMRHLEAEKSALAILQEFDSGGAEDLPFEKLSLSGSKQADVTLPAIAGGIECHIYRSGSVVLIKNTGTRAISLAGSPLPIDAIARLRPHQRLLIPSWSISYADLEFFLDAKLEKQTHTLYISKLEENIIAERTRTRNSLLKINFDINATIEVLQESDLAVQGQRETQVGEVLTVPHYYAIIPQSGNQIQLNQLRIQAIDAGGRFRLSKKQQSCRISNIHEDLKVGDLRLSKGLAEPVMLNVEFDQETATGKLRVIKQGKAPVLVNGAPVSGTSNLQDGCLIRISPNQGIRCRFSEGLLDEERTIIQQLRVDGLTHKFDSSVALDNIDFTLNRGEMLCIMGPSGSGKSTLMSVIAGQLSPSRGHIRFNEISLYQHHDRLANFVTYMPQEEALFAKLKVREHLNYAIRIRQPNLTTVETLKRVDTILDELSLQPLAGRQVGSPDEKSLSGGERSRLNLGLDLGSRAEVFLFDEPISGLSSKDSEHVAETLKNISRDKIVIASLHRPGSNVLSQFDKVLLLDNGGRVAFYGAPQSMKKYFKDACEELKIQAPFEESENSADFVFDVLETPLVEMVNTQRFATTRRFPPLFWQERFESYTLYEKVESGEVPAQTNLGELPRSDDNMPIPKKARRSLNEYYRIFRAHFWRSALSKFRNKGTIYATLLEAPLLAFIIAWTLRASADGSYVFHTGLHVVTYLFLSVTVGMFLGLTNSATEILRDRPTLRRERNCRYNNGLYVTAKFTTLALLAAIQCAIYITIGNWMLEIEGMWFIHWSWMMVTALCGTAIALTVSALVKSERAALSSVPLILVPQLLLAGTPLIPFEEMNRGLFSGAQDARNQGAEPIPSRFIPLRYAYEGVTIAQATQNPYEVARRQIFDSAQALKKKADFLMSYKHQGLEQKEKDRLSVLLSALTRLSAAEADSHEEALEKIQQYVDIGHHGTMEELRKIPVYSELEEPVTCASYFVNERAEGLVMKQDIQRLDLTRKERPNIFLAEKKYYGEKPNPEYIEFQTKLTEEERKAIPQELLPQQKLHRSWSTHHFCMSILGGLTLAFLVFATLIVARSNRKIS